MKVYEINFSKLVSLLLPSFLRNDRILAFLRSAVKVLTNINYRFALYRDDTDYKLSHSGQVCRLRKVLNDKFDTTDRRIEVVDVDRIPALIVYDRTDLPVMQHKREANKFLMIPERGSVGGVTFVVVVPASIGHNENKMKEYINYYKLAGMSYKIIKNNAK